MFKFTSNYCTFSDTFAILKKETNREQNSMNSITVEKTYGC